jgi:hypothetical protein
VIGELKVWSVALKAIATEVGALSPLPAPPLGVAKGARDQQERRDKETPSLKNPRWSVPRVEVGAELDAIITYSGFKAPVDATITISELDKSTARTEVARIYTTVPAGDGDHKVKWKRKPEEAQADLKADEAAGDDGPLEYRFKVETKDPKCPDESGPLWLTNAVTVKLVKEEDGSKHDRVRVVVLTDAIDEEFRAKSKGGEAKFDKVLVGPIRVRLAEPRFTGLGWSSPKVPVGHSVDAVFKYEDAIEGMKVEVVIYEFNHDGSTTEIKRAEVELAAASGEGKVPFTRTEDEAKGDMEADEREGDTGPVEYRYFVTTEEGHASEASEPLWLTHTVTLRLRHAEEEKTFPDGMELMLVGADATEHRGKLAGGEVKFEGVVCGPMTVKLARSAGMGG